MNDLLSQSYEQNRRDQLAEAWTLLINSITHELTSPLVVTRMSAVSLEEILPTLVQGYLAAVEHKLIKPIESESRIRAIEKKCVSEIKNDITRIINFLRVLFPINQKLISTLQNKFSIDALTLIDQSIQQHPFKDKNEFYLIEVNHDYSFILSCDPLFTGSLFLNLIENALSSIHQAEKGKVYIWAEEEENHNSIHIKDTGKGMDENMLSRLFNRFFAKREGEILPGLGYCRLALLQLGGDMVCRSQLGSFTEIIMRFPKKLMWNGADLTQFLKKKHFHSLNEQKKTQCCCRT